ncbi:hypothetical protein PRIC2_012451 [Phytophthora ramorum]
MADFVKPVAAQFPKLQDLLSVSESAVEEKELTAEGMSSTAGRRNKKKLYLEYMPVADLLAGIQYKRFFKGTIRCNRNRWLACHVLIHGANGVQILVLQQGREHINRAIDGDLVAIQLLPKDQWENPSYSEAAVETADDKKDVAQLEPVGVAEPAGPPEQCVSGSCLVVPVDRKIPKTKIQPRQQEVLMDKQVIVTIDSWPADSKFPLGPKVRTLGVIGDKGTETNVVLIEHDIPCNQFSDEVMRCLPPKDWKITAQNSTGRHDLRDLPVMAIDPPNCQDIDDALHVKLLVNGNLQMGVHIADVTHFVVLSTKRPPTEEPQRI